MAPSVTIPIASISMADGTAIRAALLSGPVHADLVLDTYHAGADDGTG